MNSHLIMMAWSFVKYSCHTVCLTFSRFFDTQNFILVRHIPYEIPCDIRYATIVKCCVIVFLKLEKYFTYFKDPITVK